MDIHRLSLYYNPLLVFKMVICLLGKIKPKKFRMRIQKIHI